MAKLQTEVRHKYFSFELSSEINGLKLYISTDQNYAVVLGEDNEILFEIVGNYHQLGCLEDKSTFKKN